MDRDGGDVSWASAIRKSDGPVYLAIADALGGAILAGTLAGGTRLPTQRGLADALGIDFTTVTRAYAEARRRGLIDGRVGQGTYVRVKPATTAAGARAGVVDMSMNLPPRFDDAGLAARMWKGIGGLENPDGLDLLLRYQEPGGSASDRTAGVVWIGDRLPSLSIDRVLVCPGAQGALLAVAGLLAEPGDTICVEALTFPGFRSLAAHLRIKLAGVPLDAQGILPDAFDQACREHRPKALYCNPTLHNPTTATLPLPRREALVEIARRHQVPIIEDDAYGALPVHPVPPLAALAPDLVYHVAGVAKSLSPALRVAYLIVPDRRIATRIAGAMRATGSMASPLNAAIATSWIEDGTASAVLAAIRSETAVRQSIARQVLPADLVVADPQGFHLWLQLPEPWTRGDFVARLRSEGLGVVPSDAFALTSPPEAVRLGLGASKSSGELRQSLRSIADLLAGSPAMSSLVV